MGNKLSYHSSFLTVYNTNLFYNMSCSMDHGLQGAIKRLIWEARECPHRTIFVYKVHKMSHLMGFVSACLHTLSKASCILIK